MDRYLKGENVPSAENIIRICIACNASSDYLLGLSPETTSIRPEPPAAETELLAAYKARLDDKDKLIAAKDELIHDLRIRLTTKENAVATHCENQSDKKKKITGLS